MGRLGFGHGLAVGGRRGLDLRRRSRLGRHGRQRFHHRLHRATRVLIDVLNNLLHALGNRLGVDVQEVRASHGHMHNVLVHLEELEAAGGKLLAQGRHHLQWKTALLINLLRDVALEFARARPAELSGRPDLALDGLDDVRQVNRAEVLANIVPLIEPHRLRDIEHDVFGLEALFFDPLLHDFLVAHNFHARLEAVERHGAEAFLMQLVQLVLVIVVIRRAQQDAAEAALRHEGVGALGRFGGGLLDLVERAEVLFEDVVDRLLFAQPERVVEHAGEECLRGAAFPRFLDANLDAEALILLQHQPRDVEQRIGPACHANLLGQRIHAVRLGHEVDLDADGRQFWRALEGRAAVPWAAPTKLSVATARAPIIPLAAAGWTWAAGPVAGRAIAIGSWSTEGRAVATRATAPIVTAAFAFALKVGVAVDFG